MAASEDSEGEQQPELVKATTAIGDNNIKGGKKVLVLGSCGLDRLLSVPAYPEADSKIRTTSCREIGGGNAANTATAMARVMPAAAFIAPSSDEINDSTNPSSIRIQLGTIVGDDGAGQTLVHELSRSGVDLSSPLFYQKPDTTTGMTVIIVSESEHTRTCLHTPGTCGEWSPSDLQIAEPVVTTDKNPTHDGRESMMDAIFEDVIHFHSDARHTDVALDLAKEANRRNIPVSLDVEKDRNTTSLDELLQYANIVFTNTFQIETYLNKLTLQMEQTHQRMTLPDPTVVQQSNEKTTLIADELKLFAHVVKPSMYFTRWFQQKDKQVVVTKGEQGSVHILCESIEMNKMYGDGDQRSEDATRNQITIFRDSSDKNVIRVKHEYMEQSCGSKKSEAWTVSAFYRVQYKGVLKNVSIVDTTGAGDALIGGYLAALCSTRTLSTSSSILPTSPPSTGEYEIQPKPTATDPTTSVAVVDYCLAFGSWVAGCKLQGPGAQAALPYAQQIDELLGNHSESILRNLNQHLTSFSPSSPPVTTETKGKS